MEKKDTKPTATKSNKLVDAKFFKTMNSVEIRIINLAISRLNPTRSVEQEKRFEFTVKEFMDMNRGISQDHIYENVRDGLKRLSSIWFEVEAIEGYDVTEISLITNRSYSKGKGRFMIEFNELAMPYLAGIKSNFNSLVLETFGNLKGEYSLKLYEILNRWAYQGNVKFTLEEIKDGLNTQGKYSAYLNFRRRVLDPSVKEISERTNLLVSYKALRVGRAVGEIEFWIFDKSKSTEVDTGKKRPPFPHKNKYGKFVHLDKQNPRMSSAEYGNYVRDCLAILENFYTTLDAVTLKDLRNYWVFLETNASNKSKLGNKQIFLDEIRKRGYKLVECELVEIDKKQIDFVDRKN